MMNSTLSLHPLWQAWQSLIMSVVTLLATSTSQWVKWSQWLTLCRWGDSERATDLGSSRILAARWQHVFVNFSGLENCLIWVAYKGVTAQLFFSLNSQNTLMRGRSRGLNLWISASFQSSWLLRIIYRKKINKYESRHISWLLNKYNW